MRKGKVYMHDQLAGWITESEDGFTFEYENQYLNSKDAEAISLTLPLSDTPYKSKVMFSFFDGLIPEGWLLDIAERNWKIKEWDRMGLLLNCCEDCIGAVSIVPEAVKTKQQE